MKTETPPLLAAPRGEEIRLAGLCGLLAFVTFNAGWVAGDAAQPRAFQLVGDGAATRAGTVVVFCALAHVGLQLLQQSKKDENP